MEIKQALEFLAEARKLGIWKVSINGMQAEFTPVRTEHEMLMNAIQAHTIPVEEATTPAPLPQEDVQAILKPDLSDLTPDEILYYATPHYDELQALKQRGKEDK